MSDNNRCEKTLEILDLYAAGLDVQDEIDREHLKECASCRQELQRSERLRHLLAVYAADYGQEFEVDRRRNFLLNKVARGNRSRYWTKTWRWGAIAASLVAAFLLGRWFTLPDRPPTDLRGPLVEAIAAESAREEVVNYLGRTQFFLLTLMDAPADCAADNETKRGIARRLLYQKELLEPKLVDARYGEVRNLLDELEILLLDVAEGEGCFKAEESELWKGMLRSRSTLVKLDLLQMKGRI